MSMPTPSLSIKQSANGFLTQSPHQLQRLKLILDFLSESQPLDNE